MHECKRQRLHNYVTETRGAKISVLQNVLSLEPQSPRMGPTYQISEILSQRRIADLEIINRLIELIIFVIAQKIVEIAAVLHLIENAVLIAVF